MTTIVGPVQSVSRTGLRVGGHWLRLHPDQPTPAVARGQQVQVQHCDGYAVRVEPLAETLQGPTAEQLQARCAAVQAAAEFLAERAEAKADHLLLLAEKLEQWILR